MLKLHSLTFNPEGSAFYLEVSLNQYKIDTSMVRHWQKWCVTLAIVLPGTLAVYPATPESSAERLRKLVKLPIVSLEAGFSMNAEQGFSISQSKAQAPREIAALRKELKGDYSDADRYEKLGELYSRLNNGKSAADCYQKAVALYRQRVASRPSDAEILTSFGRALWNANNNEESESVLRRSVQMDPQNALAWQTLGHYLQAQAKRALLGRDSAAARASLSPEKLLMEVARNKPAASQVTESRKRAEEASACFDKAIAVSTNSSDAYFQRALHKSFDGFLQNVIALIHGDKTDVSEVMKGMFNLDSLPDFRKASELSSREYRPIAVAAFFEAFAFTMQSRGRNPAGGSFWEQLPDSSQKNIRDAMTRLDNFAQEGDPKTAAGALDSLAMLQGFVVGDRSGGEATARRALALDPSREQTWDMLCSFLVRPESYQELRNTCEQRVRQSDTARNRVLLAKAYERLNQWDRVEQNLQAALKLDPNDFAANLAQAALFLKRRSDPGGLSMAFRFLTRAEQILKKDTKDTEQRLLQLTLTSSLYYALRGEMDKARQLLRGVLQSDKDNEEAREILAALSGQLSDTNDY